MRLWGGGAGAELLFMELEITNPHTGKTGTYEAKLLGGGLPTLETPGLRKGVGKPFDFTTNDPMRFKHFNGRFVRVERVGAGLAYDGIGAKAYATYLTFVGLGSGASALSFDTGFGFAKTPSLAAFVVGGELKLTKTDLDGHGTTTMVPYKTERGWGDGLIVRFPTGKFGARDMNREDRVRLDNFVKWWVAKL